MEDRIGWRESNRRNTEEKWHNCWGYQDQQRACRMAQAPAEKREHTGSAEKERVATKRAVGKYAGAAFAKRRNRGVGPEHQMVRWERVQVSESRTLARERGQSRSR